jgi:hypothetical protein
MFVLNVVPVTEYRPPPRSRASGLLGPISEQPHNSIETAASDALVIKRIFTPIAAHPRTGRVVFVTRITSKWRTGDSRRCGVADEVREEVPRWISGDQLRWQTYLLNRPIRSPIAVVACLA